MTHRAPLAVTSRFLRPLRRVAAPALALALTAAGSAEDSPLWLRYPAVSPDGAVIAFTYAGQVWRVPATGGEAVSLTPDEDYATRPVWSPDGGQLAFAAKRHGHLDVYVLPATGGTPQRLTQNSAHDRPFAFSPDGRWIYFASARLGAPTSVHAGSYSGSDQLYRVSVTGGRGRLVLPGPALEVSIDPSGTRYLYEDRPVYENEWRKGAVSDGAHDVWLHRSDDGTHQRLTDFRGEDRDPVWAPDGRSFYFLSERSGSFNVWRSPASPGARATQVTHHREGAVRFVSAARDGSLVYGLDGELWRLAPGAREPQRVPVRFPAGALPRQTREQSGNDQLTELQVSPDGRQAAVVARGEIFALSFATGRTRRITRTASQEAQVTFSPDGRTLYYTSERDGDRDVFATTLGEPAMTDFAADGPLVETKLVDTEGDVLLPRPSPDGRKLAYLADRRTVLVRDLATGRTVTAMPPGFLYSYVDDDLSYEWSPDSRALVIATGSVVARQDITLLDAAGERAPLAVTRSGFQDGNPAFTRDGEAVVWISSRAGLRKIDQTLAQTDLFLAHLSQRGADAARAAEQAAANPPAKPAADFPTTLEGIEQRTKRLTPYSTDLMFFAPGDGVVLLVDRDGRGHVAAHRIDLATGEHQRVLKFPEAAIAYAADASSHFLYALRDGAVERHDVRDGTITRFPLATPLTVDASAERAFVFQHCWRMTKLKFYEPTLHGRDWDALRARYARYLPHVATWEDFAEMMSELAGELNASHMGATYLKTPPIADATASLGLYFDDAYEGAGLRIAAVLAGGPADLPGSALRPGAIIQAIGDEPLGIDADPDPLLNGAGDETVRLRVQPADGGLAREEKVVAVDQRLARVVAYDRWVAEREQLVAQLSGGRLGYVHVPAMDAASYRRVHDAVLGRLARKEGLVVDVRYNTGGNLHDQLITLFTGQELASFTSRDGEIVARIPTGRWSRPTVLVQNAAAYSDGSVFPRLYQLQGIGPIVGDRLPGTGTAVWWMLLMGDTFKWGIPQLGAREPDGQWFENREIVPDQLVRHDPAAQAAGRDPQIEAAVQHLLKRRAR